MRRSSKPSRPLSDGFDERESAGRARERVSQASAGGCATEAVVVSDKDAQKAVQILRRVGPARRRQKGREVAVAKVGDAFSATKTSEHHGVVRRP